MKPLKRLGTLAVVACSVSAMAGGAVLAQDTGARDGWTPEPFPQRPGNWSTISSVFNAGGGVMAVGGYASSPQTGTSQAYQRAGDGSWQEVSVPSVGDLVGGASIPGHTWTIGWGYKNTEGTLLERAGDRWNEVPLDVPGASRVRPDAIHTIGSEVWTVGKGWSDGGNAAEYSFVKRFHDGRWQDVPLPDSAQGHQFTEIAGTGPDDVWLTGATEDDELVSLRWDGAAWHEVPVPPVDVPEGGYLDVNGLAATRGDDVWLAASARAYDNPDPAASTPVLLHWDGNAWSRADAPVETGTLGEFVHAEGALWNLAEQGPMRHDGSAWEAVPGPAQGSPNTGAALPDGRLLGIGSVTGDSSISQPFATVRG